MKYYLYQYIRRSPDLEREEKFLVVEKLIEETTVEKPERVVFLKNGFEETFKLVATISEEEELKEVQLRQLANQLRSIVEFKGKAYYYNDYQSKMGREVSAHLINNNSNRISSRMPQLNKTGADSDWEKGRTKAVVPIKTGLLREEILWQGGALEEETLEEKVNREVLKEMCRKPIYYKKKIKESLKEKSCNYYYNLIRAILVVIVEVEEEVQIKVKERKKVGLGEKGIEVVLSENWSKKEIREVFEVKESFEDLLKMVKLVLSWF